MVFKPLLQADAIDVVQIDSCRLTGVSEVLAVLLMVSVSVWLGIEEFGRMYWYGGWGGVGGQRMFWQGFYH